MLLPFNAMQSTDDITYFFAESKDEEEYDFIIVGSGPTGSAMANRLSEEKQWKILLLEAGVETESIVTNIPVICGFMEFTIYNWGYKTEPQEGFCKGML